MRLWRFCHSQTPHPAACRRVPLIEHSPVHTDERTLTGTRSRAQPTLTDKFFPLRLFLLPSQDKCSKPPAWSREDSSHIPHHMAPTPVPMTPCCTFPALSIPNPFHLGAKSALHELERLQTSLPPVQRQLGHPWRPPLPPCPPLQGGKEEKHVLPRPQLALT